MKEKKWFRLFLLLMMLVCAAIIMLYFWGREDLFSLKRLPLYIMIAALAYILIQILKRSIYKEQRWYDWLYYIGLVSIMIPTLLANEENQQFYHFLTDYGTLFLIVPVVIEAKNAINEK